MISPMISSFRKVDALISGRPPLLGVPYEELDLVEITQCDPLVRVPAARPVLDKRESAIFEVANSCPSQRYHSRPVLSYWSGLVSETENPIR